MGRVPVQLEEGKEYDRLTILRKVIFQSGSDWRSLRIRYDCKCKCGTVIEGVEGYRISSHHLKSCGCLQREKAAENGRKKRKHGYATNNDRIPEYMIWVHMRRRCENPADENYENYGGRGIRVCRRWQSFENFLDDMGRRPGKKYMIDRVDNNGNYVPSNCRWATIKESNRNRRNIRLLTINGITKGLGEWAEESGTNIETIRSRIRSGWESKEAVFGELRQIMKRVGNRWRKRNG